MDLTFFFTHRRQKLNGAWVTFLQAYGENQGGYGGRTVSVVLSEEQPAAEIRFRIPNATEPLQTNVHDFLDASVDFISVDFEDVLIRDYEAVLNSPLSAAFMQESFTRLLPAGTSLETYERSYTHYHPSLVDDPELFDVSYTEDADASSGSYIKEYFSTPVTFDIDDIEAVKAIYGPEEGWAEPEGDHVLSLLIDNPQLQAIYDANPAYIRLDASASGHHYLLSADSDLFQTNTTELNVETDQYYSQLFPGSFGRCQTFEFVRLLLGDLPPAVKEHFGIYHDLEGIPSSGWYSDFWLRLFAFSGPIRQFDRPMADYQSPYPPAVFHEVYWREFQKEFTDVPLESITQSLIYRLESDQTAYGFCDSSFIRTNTTELHLGDLSFDDSAVYIRDFYLYASTDWVSGDFWFVYASTTALTAGEYETVYSVDSQGRLVVPGYEPVDPAPPVPVPPPVDFFLLEAPMSLPSFRLRASNATVTGDQTYTVNQEFTTETEQFTPEAEEPQATSLVILEETWVYAQSVSTDVSWLSADDQGVSADQWDFELQPLDLEALRAFFYTGLALPNYRLVLTSSANVYASDAGIFSNTEYDYVLAPFELVTPTWLHKLLVDTPEGPQEIIETQQTEEVSLLADSIVQQAGNGVIFATADQWSLDWHYLTADAWTLSLDLNGYEVFSSSGWVTADMLVYANSETAYLFEAGDSEDYAIGDVLISSAWRLPLNFTGQEGVYATADNTELQADSDWFANDFIEPFVTEEKDVYATTANAQLRANSDWLVNDLIESFVLRDDDILRASFAFLSADMPLRANDRSYAQYTPLTPAVYDPLKSILHIETDSGLVVTLPLPQAYTDGDHFELRASDGHILASYPITANQASFEISILPVIEPPPFEPRLFALDDVLILEDGDQYVTLPAVSSSLYDGNTITLRVSFEGITADNALIFANDLELELLFVQPEDAPTPPVQIAPPPPPPPEPPPLTPGGPYTSLFSLVSYLYPTTQRLYPVSCDLGFIVYASTYLTADRIDIDLPGVLPPVPYELQTHFSVSADTDFSVDQDYISGDAFEVFFPLFEKVLTPRPCAYKPGREGLTADSTVLHRQQWLNPWWTGLQDPQIIDWPYVTELSASRSDLDIPQAIGPEGLRHRVFHVENLPEGHLYVHLGEESIAELPPTGRGFRPAAYLGSSMSGASLREIAAGLLGLIALDQSWIVLKTLDELLFVWSKELNNIQYTAEGPALNPSVTWGLPAYLPREGDYDQSRDVFQLAWLGFGLTQVCHYFADRPDDKRIDLPPLLGLLLEQLAYLVANAIDPIQGWTIGYYNESGQLSGPTDYLSSVMAVVFLSEYLTLSYDTELHDRAAVAWSAIAEAGAVPKPEVFGQLSQRSAADLATYKLFWAARFRQQLDVETLIAVVLKEDDRDNVFLSAILRALDFEIPAEIAFEVDEYQLYWEAGAPALWQSGLATMLRRDYPLFANPPFRLYAQEAMGHTAYAYQLQRWMWPYGYRWLTWQAEQPQGGTLGKLLYSMAFLAYFWALRYNMLRDSRAVSSSQGWALDARGASLGLSRRPYESDAHYRAALLVWLNLERGTAAGLQQLLFDRHELPYTLEEPMLKLFGEGVEERQGVFEDGVYYPYRFIRSPWVGNAEQVELLRQGGRVRQFTVDNWELDASQAEVPLISSFPRQDALTLVPEVVPLLASSASISDVTNLPGFFRSLRVSQNEVDASEDWVLASTAEVFWPFSSSNAVIEILAQGYSPRLLQEISSVITAGYSAYLKLLRTGRQLPLISAQTQTDVSVVSSSLLGISTHALELSLEDLSPEPFLVIDTVLTQELEVL